MTVEEKVRQIMREEDVTERTARQMLALERHGRVDVIIDPPQSADMRRYDPQQPRWPAGTARGGQWRDALGIAGVLGSVAAPTYRPEGPGDLPRPRSGRDPARDVLTQEDVEDIVGQQREAARREANRPPATPYRPTPAELEAEFLRDARESYEEEYGLAPEATTRFRENRQAEMWGETVAPRTEFEFTGIPPSVSGRLVRQFAASRRRFPSAAAGLEFMGTLDTRWGNQHIPDEHKVQIGPNFIAGSYPRGAYRAIVLGPRWRFAGMNKSAEQDVADGFHPPGMEDPTTAVTHEYGHFVDAFLARPNGETGVPVPIWAEYLNWKKTALDRLEGYGRQSREDMPPSKYGSGSYPEFFAEAFASAYHTPPEQQVPMVRRLREQVLDPLEEWERARAPQPAAATRSAPEAPVAPPGSGPAPVPRATTDAEMEARHPGIAFDTAGLVPEVRRRVFARFDELAAEYPEATERLRYVGTGEREDRLVGAVGGRAPTRDFYDNANSPTVYAFVENRKGRYFGFGQRFQQEAAPLDTIVKYDSFTGFHPQGTETFESVIDHEFGHLLYFEMRRRMGRDERREFDRRLEEMGIEGISSYARFSPEEAFAEAFAAMRNPPRYEGRPRPLLLTGRFQPYFEDVLGGLRIDAAAEAEEKER